MADLSTIIQLQSSCNLRDLGGYPAADGRKIKQGMLFRSGVMAYFTDADKQHLASLNIRSICDLRRSDERENEPTAWPENSGVAFLTWPDEPDLELKGRQWNDAQTSQEVYDQMVQFYRAMPVWLSQRLKGVFEQLANDKVPLLFHCSAGKDRTGLTAALILHTLGVDRDTILQDYELTNHSTDLEAFVIAHKKAGMGLTDQEHPLLKIPADIRKTMFKADVDYLIAAFDQIETDYGTVDDFLQQQFGVSPQRQTAMRERLLTA